MRSQIDMHMHSTASDGKYSPAELLEKIKESGIRIFSLTDHDTVTGAREMERLISAADIEVQFIRGIEFSCKTAIGKCHILGYNYNWDSEAFVAMLDKGKALRSQKLEQRIDFLQRNYGIVFDNNDLSTMRSMESVGKPHMAELIVKMGKAASISEAIKKYIDKCPTLNSRIPAEEVIRAIRAAGGIAVWAHPYGGVGESRLEGDPFQKQLEYLIAAGLQGLECYYSRYTMKEVESLVRYAEEKGLYISGGSDCHGRKNYPEIGTLNADDLLVGEKTLTICNNFL